MSSIIKDVIESCNKHNKNTAIVFKDKKISYTQLESQSRNLSLYLISLGIKTGDYVGLLVEKDHNLAVMILAILRLGAVYVPIDKDSPSDRINYIILDANIKCIVTNKDLNLNLDIAKKVSIVNITSDLLEDCVVEYSAEKIIDNNIKGCDQAYIIYTSGTTGMPKGVIINHQNLLSLFKAALNHNFFGFTKKDAWSQLSSYSFDFSIWEIFGCLLTGGVLHIIPNDIRDNPRELYKYLFINNLTVLNCTPSYFYNFCSAAIEHYSLENNLRLVIFGGEALNFNNLRGWYNKFGDNSTQFVNMYGITEITIHGTIYKISKEDVFQKQSIIGKPLSSCQIMILDNDQKLVKNGEVGELYISGPSVSQGYLNNTIANEKAFIKNLEEYNQNFTHVYKSGDLGRLNNDGNIEYYGRSDKQVKIRGYRIELNEVEAVLNDLKYVEYSSVFEQDLTRDNCVLSAIVVPTRLIRNKLSELNIIKKQAEQNKIPYTCLPNGLPIFYLNIDELNYMYDELFCQNNYLNHGITINDSDVVLDIGANIGMFSVFASNIAKGLKIYAVEPAQHVFDILKLNLQYYSENAQSILRGISDKSGSAEFVYLPEVSVMSSMYSDKEESRLLLKNTLSKKYNESNTNEIEKYIDSKLHEIKTTISLTTISNIIEEYNITVINLLKVDVEKSEMDVIKGIKDEHWKIIKQIVLEVHGEQQTQQAIKLLRDNNFNVIVDKSQDLRDTSLNIIYARKQNLKTETRSINTQVCKELFILGDDNNFSKLIKEDCENKLLPYMIPSKIIISEYVPLTINGKVDTSELLDKIKDNKKTIRQPVTDTQIRLHNIYKRLLNLTELSIDDKFYDCGGYSLLSFQLLIEIKKEFNVLLKPSDVQNASVYELTKLLNTNFTLLNCDKQVG